MTHQERCIIQPKYEPWNNPSNYQAMITTEEKRLDFENYSDEIKDLEQQEREVKEKISEAQWVLEQKQQKDIEIERRTEELNGRYESIDAPKMEIEANLVLNIIW